MLTKYIQAAMHHAKYELLSDGTYYGEISVLQGVYSNANSLEDCREQLQDVLEGWIVLGLRLGHSFPDVDGIKIESEKEVA